MQAVIDGALKGNFGILGELFFNNPRKDKLVPYFLSRLCSDAKEQGEYPEPERVRDFIFEHFPLEQCILLLERIKPLEQSEREAEVTKVYEELRGKYFSDQ